MGYNPSKQVWFNPDIEYIFDDDIVEYDMRDAGFNIIKTYKLLPEAEIIKLEGLGKGIERHIAIGKLQGANKELSKQMSEKLAEMRAIFINSNNLADSNIISVKKDAIFTIGICNRTTFDKIRFVDKNHYSSYIRFPGINNLEIYYSSDTIDVKGMGDSAINRHRLYMLEFIKRTIEMIESRDPRVKRFIINFVMKYKSRQLDDEYYIKFDRMSNDVDLLFNYQKIIIPMILMINKEIQ